MMRLSVLAIAVAIGTAGCGMLEDVQSVSRELAKDKSDDTVGIGAPLTLPPDHSLRPPATSSASGREATARRSQVVLRESEGLGAPARGGDTRGPSPGEREVLTRSGARSDTSDVVRKTVNIEAERRVEGEKSFTDRVLKYDPKAKPPAGEEPPARDASADTPVIKRKGEF
jgi:hypothetical protein